MAETMTDTQGVSKGSLGVCRGSCCATRMIKGGLLESSSLHGHRGEQNEEVNDKKDLESGLWGLCRKHKQPPSVDAMRESVCIAAKL